MDDLNLSDVSASQPLLEGSNLYHQQGAVAAERGWGTAAVDSVLTTGTVAVAGILNTGVAAANLFSNEPIAEFDAHKMIRGMDAEADAFYQEHEESVNAWGTVVGGIIPGGLGVKAFRVAAAGLQAKRVTGMLNLHEGLIGAREALYSANKTAEAVTGFMSSQFAGVAAKGVGANVLDALAFETAATFSQLKAPAYSDASMGDLVENIFWNAAAGGVIGGAFSGVKSYYGLRAARREGENFTWSSRHVDAAAPQTPDVEIVSLLNSRKVADGTSAILDRTKDTANTSIFAGLTKSFSRLVEPGADNLTRGVATAAMNGAEKSHYSYIPGVEKIALISSHDAEMEALEALKIKRINELKIDSTPQARGKITEIVNKQNQAKTFVDLKTGESFNAREDAFPHLGDSIKAGEKLEVVNFKKAVSVDGKSAINAVAGYHPDVSVEALQAKRYLLSTGNNEARMILNTNDFAEIEHHIQNWPKKEFSVEVGGVEYSSPSSLRQDMMEWKKQELAAAGFTREAQAKLNCSISPTGETKKGWDIAVEHKDIPTYMENPRTAVFHYSAEFRKLGELDIPAAESYIQRKDAEAYKIRNNVHDAFTDAYGASRHSFELTDDEVQSAFHRNSVSGSEGAGAGAVSGANASLDTVSNFAQKIGSFVNRTTTKIQDSTGMAMNNHWQSLSKNWDSYGVEGILLRNKLALSEANYAMITPEVRAAYEKFVSKSAEDVLPEFGMVRQDVAKYVLAAMDSGKLPKFMMEDLAVKGDRFIKTSPIVHDMHMQQVEINLKRKLHSSAGQAALGAQDAVKSFDHEAFKPVYNVPVDTNKYAHFALVAEKDGVGASSHKSVLTAKDEASLKAKIDALEADPETKGKFNFFYKGQTADYYKTLGEFDYSRGMNENVVDSTLRRKGMLGDLNPPVSQNAVKDYLQDMISWNNRMDSRLVRDMTEIKYAKTFQQLGYLGEQHELAGNSTFGSARNWWYQAKDNPYADIMKTALNISTKDNYPMWTMANEFAERTATTAFGTMKGLTDALFNSNGKDIDMHVAKINQHLEDLGIGKSYSAGMLTMHKDLVAQRPVLYASIHRAQSIFSGLTLGLDPLNALNNAIGNVMLTGELSSLLKGIRTKNPEIAGRLAGVTIPGTTDSLLGHTKLIGSAISRYFKGGDVWNAEKGAWERRTGDELLQEYRDHGIIADELRQARMLQEEFASNLNPNTQWLNQKTDAALELGRKFTGNSFAERFSRFLAADTARQITDHAMVAGNIKSIAEASTYWATTANRAQGNIISAQRPVAFQGPIGSAIGLFMSYQVNMMQQFARYAGTGQLGAAGVAMAAQTSLYGIQGLPAFNAINTHLIGNAGGNLNHKDMYTDVAANFGNKAGDTGQDIGDWILYGAGSNALGLFHPDLKFNLYTRGDINPRQWTVLPTSLDQTPIYKATIGTIKNFVDMAQNMAGGAGVRESLLHAIEHNGINRPISGLASVISGKETSSDGKLLSAIDNSYLASMVKIAGGKNLDSAQANDALYRMNAYKAHDAAAKKEIAQELRIAIGDGQGNLDTEQLNSFQQRYVKSGGKIDGFNSWAVQQYKFATVPQVNAFAANQHNSQARNMQAIMGSRLLNDLKGVEDGVDAGLE